MRKRSSEMSRLDERQIRDALEALGRPDVALAEQVVAMDDRVDALQRDIEEEAVVNCSAAADGG